jgi:hypothetical protein
VDLYIDRTSGGSVTNLAWRYVGPCVRSPGIFFVIDPCYFWDPSARNTFTVGVNVSAGEWIHFVVDQKGNNGWDSTALVVNIAAASTDFGPLSVRSR